MIGLTPHPNKKKKSEKTEFLEHLCHHNHQITWLGQNFFISWFTNPPTVVFRKVGKK